MGLKNKKILITAGPTWVGIDPVRVISNIATGQTGRILANLLKEKGARVSLLLSSDKNEKIKGICVKTFRYFRQLRSLINKELGKRFDCIIHNAAVSDYLVSKVSSRKISSKQKKISLQLVKSPKLLHEIRAKSPDSLLVMFKLEAGVSDKELIKRALIAHKISRADIVVANKINAKSLKYFVYNHSGLILKADSRQSLSKKLVSILEERL